MFTLQKEPLRGEKNVEFASGNISEFTRQLKEKENQDIWLVGGSQLIKVFLEEDLVQNLIVFCGFNYPRVEFRCLTTLEMRSGSGVEGLKNMRMAYKIGI